MITLEQALNIIGERTLDNREMLKQARRQRRSNYTESYGLPFRMRTKNNKDFETRLYVANDMLYWERFQFKLLVETDGVIDDRKFTFGIARLNDDGEQSGTIDLTDYLSEQHGSWITGEGYYPSEEIGDEDADADDFYDVLDACCLLHAEEQDSDINKILGAGTKIITIHSDTECDNIEFIPYYKYNHVNR